MSPILQPQVHGSAPSLKRPFIRLTRFEDYHKIAALEARHGLTVKSENQWLDLWLDNPAYLELDDWPLGWVIDDGEGSIVGSLGNIPSYCHLGGKRFVCASGRGWAVDTPYRAFSVMLLVQQIKQDNSDMNVIATPSPTTAALCSRLGWSRVPVGQWDRSEFWITDHAKVLQAYIDTNAPKLCSRLARAVVSPYLRLRDALSVPSTMVAGQYELAWCTSFDERFDDFWDDLMASHPARLLATRNAETLRWHFKHSLEHGRTWILTASKGTQLAGFAIFERRDIRSLNLPRALFVDFQTLSNDPHLSSSMVQFALKRCGREGVHILENSGCWMRDLQPIQPPPYWRSLDTWCYLYRTTNPELQRGLVENSSWYPTQYDGDASL